MENPIIGLIHNKLSQVEVMYKNISMIFTVFLEKFLSKNVT